MDSHRVAPMWQRIFSGLFCVGGIVAVLVPSIHGGTAPGWNKIASELAALYGAWLFGFIALRGRLPGKFPGTDYVGFGRHGSRQKP